MTVILSICSFSEKLLSYVWKGVFKLISHKQQIKSLKL